MLKVLVSWHFTGNTKISNRFHCFMIELHGFFVWRYTNKSLWHYFSFLICFWASWHNWSPVCKQKLIAHLEVLFCSQVCYLAFIWHINDMWDMSFCVLTNNWHFQLINAMEALCHVLIIQAHRMQRLAMTRCLQISSISTKTFMQDRIMEGNWRSSFMWYIYWRWQDFFYTLVALLNALRKNSFSPFLPSSKVGEYNPW